MTTEQILQLRAFGLVRWRSGVIRLGHYSPPLAATSIGGLNTSSRLSMACSGRLHSNGLVQCAIILARRGWRVSMLTEQAHALVDQFAKALELVGVAIILGGIILATVTFLRDASRTGDWRSAYPGYRSDIGRGILLGLELLVGADIISTITAPLTFESVGLLAAIVGIRTFLSFSLETEIEGCWPWQRATKDVERSVIETNR
jgi:uncharacterized membrane protein